MYIRRVKKKCSVRGCKESNCIAISRSREIGNTVIICRSCLTDALSDVDKMPAEEKTNVPKTTYAKTLPLLFFNRAAEGVPMMAENTEGTIKPQSEKSRGAKKQNAKND